MEVTQDERNKKYEDLPTGKSFSWLPGGDPHVKGYVAGEVSEGVDAELPTNMAVNLVTGRTHFFLSVTGIQTINWFLTMRSRQDDHEETTFNEIEIGRPFEMTESLAGLGQANMAMKANLLMEWSPEKEDWFERYENVVENEDNTLDRDVLIVLKNGMDEGHILHPQENFDVRPFGKKMRVT
jgi:hypothetical protein